MALLANWGPIAYVLFFLPVSYVFDRFGLRRSVLAGALLVVAGTALRTFSTQDSAFVALCHAGQFVNGASGVVVMSLPPLVSATWFPDGERILATAVSQSVNILGVGVAFAAGPVAVPYDDEEEGGDVPQSEVDDTVDDIHSYMIWMACIAAAVFLLLAAYFPAAPPTPPSRSSAVERVDFRKGWSGVLGSRSLWLVCLAYAVPGGLQIGWQAVMAIQFEHLGVTDTEVGNVGFVAIFGQAAGTAAVGLSMDHFRSRLKPSVLALLAVSSACFAWLALISFEVIPYSLPQLYVATVAGTSSFYSCVPLFFELSLMISHPTPEGLVGAFLTGVYNVVAMVFLLVMMVPDMNVTWMNYLLIVGTMSGMPLVYFVDNPTDYVGESNSGDAAIKRDSSNDTSISTIS